ncbi:DMT family transporter [Pseudonocardia nigra]|uniref:DMT family transporter n=1 Tax=Pseudonocardia nigra TaxID=1921578 RepID=UPI001C5DE625|nr:DMT family transporter [Pseudonocardia nigra]
MSLVRTTPTTGVSFLVLAGVLWGTGGLLGSLFGAAAGLASSAVATYRLAAGGLLIVGYLLGTGAPLPHGAAAWRRIAATGALAALFQTCYFTAVSITSVSLATLVTIGSTESFVPPADATWQPWHFHHSGPGTVIGHCDTGPWHIVARDGLPVAFIDWTLAGPVERRVEVAATAAWNAQLQDDDVAARHGLPDAGTRAASVRHFLDGYEVPRAHRADVVDAMIEFTVQDCAWEARRAGIGPDSTDPAPLWSLAWRARSADWMLRNRGLLRRSLQHR